MTFFAESAIALVILVGSFFLFVGSLGLARLPGLMRRLHGPTKATTLGVGAMLIASMLHFWIIEGNPSFHELLITLFLFLTAPVTAQMIAKAFILRSQETRDELPPTGRPVGWATLDPAEADSSPEPDQTAAPRP
jgi:multicomponent K+:H+ antiporter subunit G